MSRNHIRADAVVDIAFDLGLKAPKLVVVEDWDNSRVFMLTFGTSGAAKTIRIDPSLNEGGVRLAIEEAIRPKAEMLASQQRKRKAS